MTADELDAALKRGAWTPPAKPPSPARPLGETLGCDAKDARAWAEKWRLIDDQGQLWCMKDGCERHGTYPSLCCEVHLAEYRRKNP